MKFFSSRLSVAVVMFLLAATPVGARVYVLSRNKLVAQNVASTVSPTEHHQTVPPVSTAVPSIPKTPTPSDAFDQSKLYTIGEAIDTGAGIITVNSKSIYYGQQYIHQPSTGNVWLDVNLSFQNNTSGNVELGNFTITDGSGNTYSQLSKYDVIGDPRFDASDPIYGDGISRVSLNGGRKITGWIGFEIPANSSGLELDYSPTGIIYLNGGPGYYKIALQ